MTDIHRMWLGPDKMPEAYGVYYNKWSLLNPKDYVIENYGGILEQTWKNQDVIDDIISRCSKFTAEAATQIADIVSYELIYKYGGIYVNVDIEPIRSLNYLFDYYKIPNDVAWAVKEDNTTTRIVNAVLGGPKEHPFWKFVIEQLPYRYWKNPLAEMVETTGPALLTDCVTFWRRYMHQDNFMVLPYESFNSVHWGEIPQGQDASDLWKDAPGIIGIHHWGHRLTGRTNLVR